MPSVGIEEQVTDAYHGAGVDATVDVGIHFTGAAGFAPDPGVQLGGVDIEHLQPVDTGVEPFHDPQKLGLVLRTVDEPFLRQARGLVLAGNLGLGPRIRWPGDR